MNARSRRFVQAGSLTLVAAFLLGAAEKPVIPWEELTPLDWLYSLATRFAVVDSHQVHYKTPTAELAGLLESRPEPEALRHLAQAQMDLGQRGKALATIEAWANKWAAAEPQASGGAWDDAARWAWSYGAHEEAFRFADHAIPALRGNPQTELANLRIQWAEEQQALRNRREMQRAALELNPTDWASAYRAVDADLTAENLDEAEEGLKHLPKNMPAEPALLLRTKLQIAKGQGESALPAMEAALDATPRHGRVFAPTYARAIDLGARNRPDEWRAALGARFDAAALTKLFTYFKGQERGDACLSLLQQMDRRYQKELDRAGWSLLSTLYSDVDAVPESFRARLAAATFGDAKANEADLAELARLALRAGGRPLAWGNYSDADYGWVARMDPTPGFWTGGLSLLLTGQDWKEALRRLEAESIPERTFGAARALLAELAKRNPAHESIPELKLEVMQRYVDRGEGAEALKLLAEIEASGPDAVRQSAQEIGLLAVRQTKAPLSSEIRLFKARLKYFAPDGSIPVSAPAEALEGRFQKGDLLDWDQAMGDSMAVRLDKYKPLLDDALVRLEERDKTHRSSLGLILGELDRLSGAEALWLDLAARLDQWNLDDELGPRYEAALTRFADASWWNRMARFLTRQKRQAEIRGLAERIAATFRGSEMFERASDASIRIEIPEQPKVGQRARLSPWGDFVAIKALERFPHSPTVLRAAESRLMRASAWQRVSAQSTSVNQRAVVEDSLLDERHWAVLAIDAAERERYFSALMRDGALEAKLIALDQTPQRTPVLDLLVFEGYARLSQFEKAAEAASRLAAAYPGDEPAARRAVQIHRSLAGLDLSHAVPAKAIVDRTAPALIDPNPLITELGELFEETGRPETALTVWRDLLGRDPRREGRIQEVAALLWDYGHMKEALDTVEAGRTRLSRPRLLAFEAGVLREEVKDLDGAIREYLEAVRPEGDECYCSWFEHDQRSLRRLAQLMGRERVLQRVLTEVGSLKAGNEADQKTLLAFWPLGGIATPAPGLESDVDDWIDAMDQPIDPVGREEREAKRNAARGSEHDGIEKIGRALVTRAAAMTPLAANSRFLTALESSAAGYLASRWESSEARDRFFTNILARQAELAPTVEARLALEIDLAQRLLNSGRVAEADGLWKTLAARIETLPESAARTKAEVARVAFVERSAGYDRARVAWDELIAKYPWSLGVIEDRIAFFRRNGHGDDARQALEDATMRAASGHLAPMLSRLVSESLSAKDLARASRALDRLLKTASLKDAERLGAVSLQTRLKIQQDARFDVVAFATAEAAKFKPETQAQVFAEVARAASTEKAFEASVSSWIEALNRNTERGWLKEASRAARETGKPEALVSFFEKQQQRSPRDVRWAVAVRELRVATDNLAGGIEMAKVAASIRPERQALWDEAVELMERDQRFVEAADFLEGWNKPRRADAVLAGKRSALYIRGGDLGKALAVEEAAEKAFEETGPSEEDLANHKTGAARRLWREGQPQLAWRFLGASSRPAAIEGSGLTIEEQFQLALLNDNFMTVLSASMGNAERREAAGRVLGQYGRIEQREQVLTWFLEKLFPSGRVDETFLNEWWSFASAAHLENAVRLRVAQRFARQITGPWSQDTPVDLLSEASDAAIVSVAKVNSAGSEWKVKTPDLDALWAAHLVRFDRADELAAYLKPRFDALLVTVRGSSVVTPKTPRLPWTRWLDSEAAIETFARGLKSQPELVAALSSVFENRRQWDRLWVLGAVNWRTSPLIGALAPQSRVVWMSFWERPVTSAGTAPGQAPAVVEDPILLARRNALNETSISLSQFLAETTPAAPPNPLAERLLGPKTLGDVLGKDPRFTWPVFRPRLAQTGEISEVGDDRIAGRGLDVLRFPGAFWGERPGLAWYALQTYARYRAQDPSAIAVPGEWPEAGNESERGLLSARLSLALQGPAAAIALVERLGLKTSDPDLLRFRLRLLVDAGRKADAEGLLKKIVTAEQKTLSETALREYSVMAEDFGLPSPLSMLDPEAPIAPALLASIYDHHGAGAGLRFKTLDPVGFRSALTVRWSEKAGTLKTPELRVWLSELWAHEAAPLPLAGLSRLGDFWAIAAPWAQTVPERDRPRAIAAIDALPQTAPFDALGETMGDHDARRLVTIRVRLARGEDDAAVDLFNAALETNRTERLNLQEIAPTQTASGSEEEGGAGEETDGEGSSERETASEITPIRALRAPFVAARKAALIQSATTRWLDARMETQPDSLDFWDLRFEVTPATEHPGLIDRLNRAYRRGDIPAHRRAEFASLLVRHAKELGRPFVLESASSWTSFYEVTRHAGWLRDAGLKREAALYVVEARGKSLFTRSEEIQAFDFWRRNINQAIAGPEIWKQAQRFWADPPDSIAAALVTRLKDHPFDVLSARAALRRPTALPAQAALSARRALRDIDDLGVIDLYADEALLRLRAARSMLDRPRAAATIGGDLAADSVASDLIRRRFKAADVSEALADVARLSFASADRPRLRQALELLADRKWDGARALRDEFAAALIEPPVVTHRQVDGRSLMYRPRDLTFGLVSQIVDSDLSRRAKPQP